MNLNKTIEIDLPSGGLTIFLYQLAFGLSFRYLSCLKKVMFRLYLGPFKLWLTFPKSNHEQADI